MSRVKTMWRFGRWLLVALTLTCVQSRAAAPGEWRQFGGNGGDFVEPALPGTLDWGVLPPREAWSRVLGGGNSAIVGDTRRVFAHDRPLDTQGQPGIEERVSAYAFSDGRRLWEYRYEAPGLPGQEQYGGGIGPHATPLDLGDRVVTLGYSGRLTCLGSADGALKWSRNLVTDLGADPVQFGFAASPVAADGRLLVQAAGKQGGLAAFDPATGDLLWHSPPTRFSYATPVSVSWSGQTWILLLTGDDLQAVDPGTGSVQWRHPLRKPGLTVVPTPVWFGDGRILISGQGTGGTELLRVTREGGVWQVHSVWRSSRVTFFSGNFAAREGHVFGGDAFLYGLDLETGDRMWSERGFADSNLLLAGDRALVLTRAGDLLLARMNPKGVRIEGTLPIFDGEAWTPPSLVGTRVFARNREFICAIELDPAASIPGEESIVRLRLKLRGLVTRGEEGRTTGILDGFQVPGTRAEAEAVLTRFALGLIRADRAEAAVGLLTPLTPDLKGPGPVLAALGEAWVAAGDPAKGVAALRAAAASSPGNPRYADRASQLDPDVEPSGNAAFRLPGRLDAKVVTVAGSFNGWNPTATPMRRRDGGWEIRTALEPGQYEYKFVVDGKWMVDPSNPRKRRDTGGNENSVIEVP